MHFGITEKPTMSYVSRYNTAGLISEVSEEIASPPEGSRGRAPIGVWGLRPQKLKHFYFSGVKIFTQILLMS